MNTLNWTLLCTLALLLFSTSCKDDDNDLDPDAKPEASFTVELDELEARFTNTSTNANSYDWDFGDGNSSTEENPTHTYAQGGNYTVTLEATNGDEANTARQSIDVVAAKLYQSEGYFLTSISTSSAGTNYFGGYFPEVPSGDIDLTQYQSFPFMFFRERLDDFLFGQPADGVNTGLTKYAIDINTNQIVEVATIPTINAPSVVELVSENLGFFANFLELSVTAFNPTTMEELSTIDLSAEVSVDPSLNVGISGLFYNETTEKLVATLYVDNPATGQFYDDVNVYAQIVNVNTLSREKLITHPEATYAIFRGERNKVIDEAGNMYLIAAGQYGLDGQVGPLASKGSRPQIIKINTNTEFEADYAWNPIDAVGLENNFIQIFTSMVYASNGKGYGIGTAGPESAELLQLLVKLAEGTITAQELDFLRFLVFADEAQKIIEVDFAAKTAQFVSGGPLTAGFAYPFLYNYDGTIFSQVTAEGGAFNGYYSIDPSSSTATPAFNITQGGFAGQLYKLGESK
ncbi:MAG: PKD domain-containing protein [Bacteroidota bacterium]